MTLEQQVADLVSATTELTTVVNSELNKVRNENNSFKSSTLTSIDTRFNDFISQFDQVKLKDTQFTIYVDPVQGSVAPANPVNNELDPFNTIGNALAFLRGYYWTFGNAIIKLSAGIHLVNGSLTIEHPCSIKIEGYSVPAVESVAAITSQTTNANRSGSASTPGSNANLFDHLSSIFQSHIVITQNTSALFRLNNTNFYISNCFLYTQNKNNLVAGISLGRIANVYVTNCAFMYFSNAIQVYSSTLQLEGFVLASANTNGLVNYWGNISSASNVSGYVVHCSGNSSVGLSNSNGSTLLYVAHANGNGSHGFSCGRGELSVDSATSTANGGDGFVTSAGNMAILNSVSQNNGGFGYRAVAGIIKAIGSDASTTGNTSGKKSENNAQQAYVVGVNI